MCFNGGGDLTSHSNGHVVPSSSEAQTLLSSESDSMNQSEPDEAADNRSTSTSNLQRQMPMACANNYLTNENRTNDEETKRGLFCLDSDSEPLRHDNLMAGRTENIAAYSQLNVRLLPNAGGYIDNSVFDGNSRSVRPSLSEDDANHNNNNNNSCMCSNVTSSFNNGHNNDRLSSTAPSDNTGIYNSPSPILSNHNSPTVDVSTGYRILPIPHTSVSPANQNNPLTATSAVVMPINNAIQNGSSQDYVTNMLC